MRLRGQHGYAMVALLVGMTVMAIMMTVAMPAWRQMAQREKEAELIFRGQQYARAIGLFQRRAGPGVLPPNLDVLVDQKFLRKKYKDPITGGDFDLLRLTSSAPTGGAPGVGAPGTPVPGAQGRGTPPASSAGSPGGAAGPIMGVASKSTQTSLRLFNGRSRYNEWQFMFVEQRQAPGGGQEGRGGAGGADGPRRGGSGRGAPGPPGQRGFGSGGFSGSAGSGTGPPPPQPPRR